MKINILLIAVLFFTVLAVSCKKINPSLGIITDPKGCWQLFDQSGNDLALVCNKTEAEMTADYGGRSYFYRTDAPLFCWKLQRAGQNPTYITNKPEAWINALFANYTRENISCSSFCNWQIFYRSKSKITGNYTPTIAKNQTIFNTNDTCGKLFVGRTVTVSETTDSLHTAEFVRRF